MTHLISYMGILLAFVPGFFGHHHHHNPAPQVETYDVVVYGGSSAGVMAALQASSMGKSVVLIAPSGHLGGMTSNGLGMIDVKQPTAIGGLARQYFENVWNYYYDGPEAWVWGPPQFFTGQLADVHYDDHQMWAIEPHVAEINFDDMIEHTSVNVVRRERLDRQNGVTTSNQRIVQIAMETGRIFVGKMFIDASYEGDLMAAAHVTYFVGREPNSRYNETHNGIHPSSTHIRTSAQLDPYVVKGDPTSGLLPRVYPDAGGNVGDGDTKVQSYNYRMCLTNNLLNQVRVEKPDNYDEKEYEILLRSIEAGRSIKSYIKLSSIPNMKTDANNNGPISTDYVGMSWEYPEADYATRERIARAHERWQRGLIWTLQNHPRVTEKVRNYYLAWGLAKDEFADNNNWPYEIYVREARRMISPVVIDEHTALGKVPVSDSIGISAYAMDSHAIKYIVSSDGFLSTEGGLYQPLGSPFCISYQAIVPAKEECENLLVPVCLSASHAAYGSIRMEPTFMVLGQSAATAACLAIDANVALQDLPYETLQQRLLADGQVLKWTPPQ